MADPIAAPPPDWDRESTVTELRDAKVTIEGRTPDGRPVLITATFDGEDKDFIIGVSHKRTEPRQIEYGPKDGDFWATEPGKLVGVHMRIEGDLKPVDKNYYSIRWVEPTEEENSDD